MKPCAWNSAVRLALLEGLDLSLRSSVLLRRKFQRRDVDALKQVHVGQDSSLAHCMLTLKIMTLDRELVEVKSWEDAVQL